MNQATPVSDIDDEQPSSTALQETSSRTGRVRWIAIGYVGSVVLALLAIAVLQAPPREANSGHWTAMLLAIVTVGILALARVSVFAQLAPRGGPAAIATAVATEAICTYFTFTRLWNVSHGLGRPEDPTISLASTLMQWFGIGIVVTLIFVWVTRRRGASLTPADAVSVPTGAEQAAEETAGNSSWSYNRTDRALLITGVWFAGLTALVVMIVETIRLLRFNAIATSDLTSMTTGSIVWDSADLAIALATMIIGRFAFYWGLARLLEPRVAVTVILAVEIIAPYIFVLLSDFMFIEMIRYDISVALFPALLVGSVPFGTIFVTAGVGAAALGVALIATRRNREESMGSRPGSTDG